MQGSKDLVLVSGIGFNYKMINDNRNPFPPKTVLRLLSWFCPEHLYEEIEGDLIQKFTKEVKAFGEQKAKRRLVWNTLRFFRPGIILRHRFTGLTNNNMLRSYIKIMMRNLVKRKVYSAINITGLTIGITFALLMGVFVWEELQVNKQLTDVDRLYILEQERTDNQGFGFFAPVPLAKLLAQEYPSQVENYYRFYDRNIKVSKDDKHFLIQSMIGDSTFLRMFGFPVLHGDATAALDQPYSIVITEKIAQQFFDRSNVVGESLLLSSGTTDQHEYIITAVVPDLGRNSVSDLVNINAQIFIPLQNAADYLLPDTDNWQSGEMITYIKLAPGASEAEVENSIRKAIQTHGTDLQKNTIRLKLVGLDDYYLITQNGAAKKMIYVLSGIAAFILLLAVINFVNISIASASVRLKEIGVRKVIGGMKKQIIFQFLSESLVITLFAGVVSLVLYELLRPGFGELINIQLSPSWKLNFVFWQWFAVSLFAIGLLAGIYPAFFLSSYHTIESLKGKLKEAKDGFTFSKVLVTAQFLVAILVFTCSLIITRQVSFFLQKDLGYDKSSVLTVSSVPRIWTQEGINRMSAAKKEFMTSSRVEAVSLSWEIPNGNNSGDGDFYKYGTSEEAAIKIAQLVTDEDYADVYQLKLLEGKFFYSPGEEWKPFTVVINESTSKQLKAGVGDQLKIKGVPQFDFTVVGIINDFNLFSLRDPVRPMILFHTNGGLRYRFFSFKLQPGNLAASVEEIQSMWKKIFPDDPFDYQFMDERVAAMYQSEQRLKKTSAMATGIMLAIVLIGVLGLVALNVTRRNKEIGIRKVLGASVTSILVLFSREYVRMILTAFVIAIPASVYFINQWLDGFAYRIALQWWMFALPGTGLLLVSLLVVMLQSGKAAGMNPVKSLRSE